MISTDLKTKINLYTNNINSFHNINGLVQERRNSSALAMELHLFCTNPSIWNHKRSDFTDFTKTIVIDHISYK